MRGSFGYKISDIWTVYNIIMVTSVIISYSATLNSKIQTKTVILVITEHRYSNISMLNYFLDQLNFQVWLIFISTGYLRLICSTLTIWSSILRMSLEEVFRYPDNVGSLHIYRVLPPQVFKVQWQHLTASVLATCDRYTLLSTQHLLDFSFASAA